MSEKQICQRCVMDTTVATIRFDESGVCNYCKMHDAMDRASPKETAAERLTQLVARIQRCGRGRKYDCIVGISGGTDSTYALLKAKELGLRPLAVHYDNGWNSELAVSNIQRACEQLDVDLHTEVADWEEFKDLQISFLKASVPDAEMPTDLGIFGTLYRIAAAENVRFILNGASFRTEGKIPLAWGYGDGRYIRSIHRRFGHTKLRDFPNLTLTKLLYYTFVRRIRVVRFLEYMDYTKANAKSLLTERLGWRDYGGHHHESIYTRYYQSHLSPHKFGMDRRMVTLSAAVREGAMDRQAALDTLATPSCPPEVVADDEQYIIHKLALREDQFRLLAAERPKSFLEYPTYYPLFRMLHAPINLAYQLKLSPTRFHESVSKEILASHFSQKELTVACAGSTDTHGSKVA